jgi:hypothetical protein
MAGSSERRAEERMAFAQDTTCTAVAPIGPDVGPARLRDVSMEGLGLILTRPAEVGAMIAVTLANNTKGFTKIVIVRVTHVTRTPGAYLIGGNFTTPLTYQELSALVM